MKNFTFILIVIAFCAVVSAQPISYESFDYSAGNLNEQNGGNGWISNWYGDAGGVGTPGLSYSSGGRNLLTSGNTGANDGQSSIRLFGTNNLDHLLFNDNGTNKFGKLGTTNWFSFIVQQTNTNFTDWIAISIHDGSTWGNKETLALNKKRRFTFQHSQPRIFYALKMRMPRINFFCI